MFFEIIFAALLISAILLLTCTIMALKVKTLVAKAVRRLLIPAFFAVVLELAAIIAGNADTARLLFTFSMICFNGTIAALSYYTLVYTESGKAGKVLVCVTYVGALFDSIILLIGNNSNFLFKTGTYIYNDRYKFNTTIPTSAYTVRWTAILLIVCFCLIPFIYRAIRAPHIYKAKFICIVGAIMIPLGAYAAFTILKPMFDMSVLFFGLTGATIYYFSLIHAPREVISGAHSRVISGLSDPVVTLDYNARYIDMNDSAAAFFDVPDKGTNPGKAEKVVYAWLELHNLSIQNNFGSVNLIDYKDDNQTPAYINVKIQVIYDEKGSRIGYFLQIHDYTEQELRRQKDWYAATHDSLTGLLNRSAFMEYARATIEDYPDRSYVIVCSDIENFKLVNDIFGENYGDEMLRNISKLLAKNIAPDEYLGRLGNDIFAFIIEKDHLVPDNLIQVSRDLIPEDMRLSLQVHIQFGVYEVSGDITSVSVMCERALIAIKNVKGRLEDAVVYYDDKLREDTLEEQELISEIEPAIDRGEFVFFLQPQVNSEGKILGGEALVRWIHPQKGLVPPGKFIGILEKKGLIPKLDRCIWEQACAKLREWKDIGRDDLYISVNISPRDFYYLDVYQTFVDLVNKYGIAARNLRLEITETAVMQNLSEQVRLIDNLRQARFLVEMDDFGSGYSSLNTLKDIHMDILKIDMGFLGGGIGDDRSRTILELVVDLANRLNMPTVIEGVEHEDEVEFLKSIGCNVFQGYFFAKPMDTATFEERYMNIKKHYTA